MANAYDRPDTSCALCCSSSWCSFSAASMLNTSWFLFSSSTWLSLHKMDDIKCCTMEHKRTTCVTIFSDWEIMSPRIFSDHFTTSYIGFLSFSFWLDAPNGILLLVCTIWCYDASCSSLVDVNFCRLNVPFAFALVADNWTSVLCSVYLE